MASASDRIVTALAYSPTGRVSIADVLVAGNDITESYVAAVLEQSTEVASGSRDKLGLARRALHEQGRPVESYRRLSLDDALARV